MTRRQAGKSSFLGNHVWTDLAREVRRAGRAQVAVAFLGRDAFRRMPLKRGSELVVNASAEALATGQTFPEEIRKYLAAGVRVRSCDALHAKVFVLGDTVWVGSANASASSETRLREAMLSSRDRRIVSAARKFVRDLPATLIGPETLRLMSKTFRAPKFVLHGATRKKSVDGIWVVRLEEGNWTEETQKAADATRAIARRRMTSRTRFELQEFDWVGTPFAEKAKDRQQILQLVTGSDRRLRIEPLGTIVHRVRYKPRRGMGSIVRVEVPVRRRTRRLKAVSTRLRVLLRKVDRARWITTPESVALIRSQLS